MTYYLIPRGMLYGSTAANAVSSGAASWLAGTKIAYSVIELVENVGNGYQHSQFYSYSDFLKQYGEGFSEYIDRLNASRSKIAGIDFSTPTIMGIVNVTPDSFSDGGDFTSLNKLYMHCQKILADGADIIDIGGESTRPGAKEISIELELERVVPAINILSGLDCVISIDTRKPEVMQNAVVAGAKIINDVTALRFSSRSMEIVSNLDVPIVLMHSIKNPENMQSSPNYDNVLLEIYNHLQMRINDCLASGVNFNNIMIDPGIGFGKTLEHNLRLLADIAIFHGLGVPIVLGTSRKSFIGHINGSNDPKQREEGSIASAISGIMNGVQVVRVHNVRAMSKALSVWQSINTI